MAEATQYDGTAEDAIRVIDWITEQGGMCFSARELRFRHDFGTYWHPEHGFVYVPQGARRPGQAIEPLRDNELIVLTDANIYAVVFPGDYVVRSLSGFYPLASESYSSSYVSTNHRRRGVPHRVPPAS
jgi:hypothetical protein